MLFGLFSGGGSYTLCPVLSVASSVYLSINLSVCFFLSLFVFLFFLFVSLLACFAFAYVCLLLFGLANFLFVCKNANEC